MKENMGDLIAERRKALGMTQKELAHRLNITDKAVSKWERNLACPDIGTLPKLAEVLGFGVDTLLNLPVAEKKKTAQMDAVVDTVLKVLPLAMGIALVVLSILKKDLELHTVAALAGIGMFAASLYRLRHE